jgi:lysozyme
MQSAAVNIAAAICERWEGFYSRPYLCPAGVPTVGFGTTRYPNGQGVTLRDPEITRVYALHMLKAHLAGLEPQVRALCPGLDTPERVGAVLSWTYNLGAGSLRASTMRRRINEQNWPAARSEMVRWNKAGGRVLRGLTARRADEAALL